VERRHITDAFVFELSKCERVEIRERMVAGLRNVDDALARSVADGLGLEALPRALPVARRPITDLAPSPALSILANPPGTFSGRKLGVLVTDGADARILARLRAAAKAEQANVELVAPTVRGVQTSDGKRVSAEQRINGGPSVLYDAVAVVASETGAAELAGSAAARDFVTDAYSHCKFIGYVPEASALFEAAGLHQRMDDGFIELAANGASAFLERCRAFRHWDREQVLA